MISLYLSEDELRELELVLNDMECQSGTDYSFEPELSVFSCKCSGPAQSCAWH